MSPYLESETFPRGRRVILVPLAGLFLLGPYGLMIGGGPSSPIAWVLTAIAIVVGALFAGAGIAQPRRSLTFDGEAQTIAMTKTAPLPAIGVRQEIYDFRAVTTVKVIEVGTKKTNTHGFRVIVQFETADEATAPSSDTSQLALKRQTDPDRAQDIVDHLVLLGLPGRSRAAQREAILDAAPPTTWL